MLSSGWIFGNWLFTDLGGSKSAAVINKIKLLAEAYTHRCGLETVLNVKTNAYVVHQQLLTNKAKLNSTVFLFAQEKDFTPLREQLSVWASTFVFGCFGCNFSGKNHSLFIRVTESEITTHHKVNMIQQWAHYYHHSTALFKSPLQHITLALMFIFVVLVAFSL